MSSAWVLTLKEWLAFMEKASKVVVLSLLRSLPVAYGADGTIENGDEFSNNLFSDLAPLMTLFGEQVTKQFISQSMGWADNILLAMAPLGILTVMVSAIRVGGEQWLKNVIGRARESDGLAEAELMSSTSSDVCELWGGRGVVRVLGSPDLVELAYRVDDSGRFIEEKDSDNYHQKNTGGIHILEGAIQGGLYGLKYSNGSEEPTTLKEPPNLALNVCGPGVGKSELWVYAVLGFILQVSVWVWCVLTVVFFKYEKGAVTIKPYALPMTITGSFLVCLGVLLCSHVVEARTTECTYRKSKNVRTVFLQRGGQVVNDQRFEGYAIFAHPEQIEIKTSRKNKASFGALVNIATTLALLGFIAQFIGLRAMHWSCTIAQLLATLIITILRATARRGLSTLSDATPITEGYELRWLAKHLSSNDRWAVETGFIGLGPRSLIDKSEQSSASGVVSLLEKLHAITDWERPSKRLAISTGRAMENILNIITDGVDITTTPEFLEVEKITCGLPINCNGSHTVIDFSVHRVKSEADEWGPWVSDISKLEAILSLWALSQDEAENDYDIADKAVKLFNREETARMRESDGREDSYRRSPRNISEGEVDIYLLKSREAASPREVKYSQYRLNRQRHGFLNGRQEYLSDGGDFPEGRDFSSDRDFLQILGRFEKCREQDYQTWMELRRADEMVDGFERRSNHGISKVSLSEAVSGPDNRENPPFLDKSRQWHTNFGFAFDPYSGGIPDTEDTGEYLTTTTKASKDDILGLDLVAKFMWEVVKHINGIHGVTRRRIINLERSGSALINSALNKMAQSIVEAGLGDLQDAYHIIIPPLSAAKKLPSGNINAAEKVIEV